MGTADTLTLDSFTGSGPITVSYDELDAATLGALSLTGDRRATAALLKKVRGVGGDSQ